MSTCGSSLRHIFESTITENSASSSLIDTLSSPWKQIRPIKPSVEHSFTEIFGELHFKESPDPVCASAATWQPPSNAKTNEYRHRRSESLQFCTEGLGSESADYTEDLKVEFPGTWLDYNKNDSENCKMKEKMNARGDSGDQFRRRRRGNGMVFPPPISCIGKTGKLGVWFQSSRQDGRFILEGIKIPTYERFHASREDGRLRLCFIQQADELDEDDDNDDDDDGNDAGEAVDTDDNCTVENEEKDETFVNDSIERGHS